MGSYIEPNRELSFGGPSPGVRRKFLRGGEDEEDYNPFSPENMKAGNQEYSLARQKLLSQGLPPESADYILQMGPQAIEVDTDTWLGIVGALSGGYAAAGESGIAGVGKEVGEEVLDRALDWVSETTGVPLNMANGARGLTRGRNAELPSGSVRRAPTGSRANRNMQDGVNVQPSSGEAFVGHNPTQTRNAMGQYGPNTAGGVSTSGQRLPSVRPSTQVATRNAEVMAPNSPMPGGQSTALATRGNTIPAPRGGGVPAPYVPGPTPSPGPGGIGMLPVAPLIGQAVDAYFQDDEEAAAPEPMWTPPRNADTTSGYPGVGRPLHQGGNERREQPSAPVQSRGSDEFNQAFRDARHRGDLEFEFGDKMYGTRRADETNEQWNNSMDQVKIKARGAQTRNTPEEIGIRQPEEISFDRPQPSLQRAQPTVKPKAASTSTSRSSKPASSKPANKRSAIKDNRQENRNIRQSIRQDKKADRQTKRADRLENRAAKLRGNSKPTANSTSSKSSENKATEKLNQTINRPMKTGGMKDRRKMSKGGKK